MGLYDAEHKRRRRLRKTKSTLLLDRSLIDLIDNVGPSDLNDDTELDENENAIDIDPSHSNDVDLRDSVECDIEDDHKYDSEDEHEEQIELQIEENTKEANRRIDDDEYDEPRLHKVSSLSSI